MKLCRRINRLPPAVRSPRDSIEPCFERSEANAVSISSTTRFGTGRRRGSPGMRFRDTIGSALHESKSRQRTLLPADRSPTLEPHILLHVRQRTSRSVWSARAGSLRRLVAPKLSAKAKAPSFLRRRRGNETQTWRQGQQKTCPVSRAFRVSRPSLRQRRKHRFWRAA